MGDNGGVKSVCNVCKVATQLKCRGCVSVFYCNKQHQREDWPNHKKLCVSKVQAPIPDQVPVQVSVPKEPLQIPVSNPASSSSDGVCGKCGKTPAPLKCPACETAYCCRDHQNEDTTKHNERCKAYEVCVSPEMGPHLVAARDFDRGEVILMEAPFAVGPPAYSQVKFCIGCFAKLQPDASSCCSQCKWPACKEKCEGLKDSQRHLAECSVLKAVGKGNQKFPWGVVLPLRCLMLQVCNPSKWKWIQEVAPYAPPKLVDREQQRRGNELKKQLADRVGKAWPKALPAFSMAAAKAVLNVIDANSLPWKFRTGGELVALYPNASLLLQSCCANTRLSFEDAADKENLKAGIVNVTAVQNIRRGEVLTCCKVSPSNTTLTRVDLLSFANLRCRCARCKDPSELGTEFSTFKCPRCSGCIRPVDLDKIKEDWRCSGCGFAYDYMKLSFLELQLLNNVRSVKSNYRQRFIELLKMCEQYLHPNHFICLFTKWGLIQTYNIPEPQIGVLASILGGMSLCGQPNQRSRSSLSNADLERSAELGRSIMAVLEKLGVWLIGANEFVAACFLNLGRAEVEIMKRKIASGVLYGQEAKAEYEKCRGLLGRGMEVVNAIFSTRKVDVDSELWDVVAVALPKEYAFLLMWAQSNGFEDKK